MKYVIILSALALSACGNSSDTLNPFHPLPQPVQIEIELLEQELQVAAEEIFVPEPTVELPPEPQHPIIGEWYCGPIGNVVRFTFHPEGFVEDENGHVGFSEWFYIGGQDNVFGWRGPFGGHHDDIFIGNDGLYRVRWDDSVSDEPNCSRDPRE